VPFLRFSRDKRGYEHTYLVHTPNRRGKPSRPRVLYWYRTPPGIKVGRPPFDEEARRRLEAQNPDVAFDWATIVATPMPPPAENEQWRERRRAERAAKYAQRAEEAAERRDQAEGEQPGTPESDELVAAGGEPLDIVLSHSDEAETPVLDAVSSLELPSEIAAGSSQPASGAPTDRPRDPSLPRRRRRGDRRHRRGRLQPERLVNQATPGGENPGAPTVGEHGSSETLPDSPTKESIESTDE
jgi:hypothetical protein